MNTPDAFANPAAMADRAAFVRNQLPDTGLFADQHWRIAPAPFPLDPALLEQLDTLGRVFLQFNRSVNLLYRQSLAGRRPAWVAQWLDQGKSPKALGLLRAQAFRHELPRVIRPDLLLTEHGLALTELDAVPGGIGLTAWLNETYAQLGFPVVGGANGMFEGFAGIFGEASLVHIVVSEESSAYRPEMDWLARQLNRRGHAFTVRDSQPFAPAQGEAAYRFFELFDVDNVPAADGLFEAAARNQIRLTPPPKSIFEEKLLFALLWNRNLRDFWRQELGEAFFEQLKAIVPQTWMLDPAPLPPHAAFPGLDLTDWQQLKELSQRDRDLILKVSGYANDAWGARGVFLGSDLSAADWSAVVDQALLRFPSSPFVLQRYAKPKSVPVTWFDFDRAAPVPMNARVRLSPYYFVSGEREQMRPRLGGVLATLCPADKKIIHGMRDAVLCPCSPSAESLNP
jgi:hypothetical protein